jgi:hypothetical protein
MLDVSQQTVGSVYSKTPLIQAHHEDGPQYKTHSARMVRSSKPWTESFPFISTTEELPTEEQSHGIELQNLMHYIFFHYS